MLLTKYILPLLALQVSNILASPTSEDLTDPDVLPRSGLEKRYPIQLNFDNTVSAGDRTIINNAFQDMQTLAAAAANYDYSNTAGNVDGIYRRYFPQGQEDKVRAMFRFLAGIPQTWGGTQLTTPDFSRITISRKAASLFTEAATISGGAAGAANYNIVFYNLGFPPVVKARLTDVNYSGQKTSVQMEMLAAIVLHELLHCTVSITTPIMCYSGPTNTAFQATTIDDQQQSFLLGITEKSYGPYLSAKLKDHNAPAALINNDNFMYFALEAYFRPRLVPNGAFAPADRECLPGCTQFYKGLGNDADSIGGMLIESSNCYVYSGLIEKYVWWRGASSG